MWVRRDGCKKVLRMGLHGSLPTPAENAYGANPVCLLRGSKNQTTGQAHEKSPIWERPSAFVLEVPLFLK